MTTQVSTIDFHGKPLITAKIDGDIFVAMKPIVEGMGLAWQTQHRKFAENKERWGITEMVIPSAGGEQGMSCLPIRKLNGWLMTIHPNKIKDETIRANVVMYQNECDDVLWKYFTEGVAVNDRITITPEQQSDLQAIVATISPDGRRRGEVWARFNRHFKIAKYSQLPSGKIEEARNYLIETFLDGQYIEDNPYPLVDIKKVLTGGMDDPIVPFSDELQRAINAKSFEVAHEFLETFQKHLSRRIAYTCEVGFPNRVINEQKALDVVRDTSIDTALTHHFYGLLTNVQMMADSIKAMTGAYSNDIANALGKKQLMIA